MYSRQKSMLLVLLLVFQTWMVIHVQPISSSGGEGVSAPLRVRSTMTEFSWQPPVGDEIPNNVSLVGEWNWEVPAEMSLNSSTGIWSVELELDEGIYCYKIILDGTDYIFDVHNPERIYCDGMENSLARVNNHTRSTFSLELDSVTGLPARILLHSGSDGSTLLTGGPILKSGFYPGVTTFNQTTEAWDINLSVLPEGKHTFHANGVDDDGYHAEDILIPFWLGESADFEWQQALIYMVMTDRFVNGNSSNDGANAQSTADGAEWQGGDFAGVTEMIESGYFSNLGVNALWLTPFNSAAQGSEMAGDGTHEVSSYHGYWPIAPRSVDERLGTEAELEAMVDAAHENGIRVMMDFVVNHVHEDHPYYSENPDWFNQGCLCGSTDCDWTEHRLDCLFRNYMPDLDWKNRNASEQMIADGLWWLERFDLDGARIDAVKHVDDLAIYNFASRVSERFESGGLDYYLKGETAMGWSGHELSDNLGQYEMINRYMSEGGLDGQADFVLYHAVIDNVFTTGQMDYQHLDYWTNRSNDQYVDDALMVNFIGSHDSPRFISRADSGTADEWNQWSEQGLPGQPGIDEPYSAALQAFTWLMTSPNVPMIYMGDEYGEYGGADPDNRHMYRNMSQWNDRESSLAENVSALGRLRADLKVLQYGNYSTIYSAADTLAIERSGTNGSALVVLNRGDEVVEFACPAGANNSYDLRFGQGQWQNDLVTIAANQVAIFALNTSIGEGSEIDEDNNSTDNNSDNGTNNSTSPLDGNSTQNMTNSSDTGPDVGNGSGNTSGTDINNTEEGGNGDQTEVDEPNSNSSQITVVRAVLLVILGLLIIRVGIHRSKE